PAQPQHDETPSLSWDDPPPHVPPSVTPAVSAMPAWDSEPRTREIPALTVAPAAASAPEPQWGFDEAQIETARRAAVPLHSPHFTPATDTTATAAATMTSTAGTPAGASTTGSAATTTSTVAGSMAPHLGAMVVNSTPTTTTVATSTLPPNTATTATAPPATAV